MEEWKEAVETIVVVAALTVAWQLAAVGELSTSRRVPVLARRPARRSRALPARWTLPVLIAAVAAPSARGVEAQTVRYGVVLETVRDTLGKLWSDDPRQLERAYCVSSWSYGVYHVSREDPIQDDTIFRVFGMRQAPVRSAGPSSVDFECPPGVPEMHTHTPTTCRGDDVKSCVTGGLNAYSCQPSRQDLLKLLQRGDPFGLIQCDRRSFRFYFASEYLGGTTIAVNKARARGGHDVAAQRGNVILVQP
jgi:hypothetical protein